MTNNEKRRSPEFPEIRNVGVPEFSGNGKHRKFQSFRKSNNKQISIPRKLTGVPGCVRTVGTDSNIYALLREMRSSMEGLAAGTELMLNMELA